MKLRPSRVLRKLRAGEVASCLRMNLADPRVAEIAARCGFDCIWSDMEHAPNTLQDAEKKCLQCHDLDNSPAFQEEGAFDRYWKKIAHGGKSDDER